jgi:hypothetical protein
MISKNVLCFTPGATPSQKEKAANRCISAYTGTTIHIQIVRIKEIELAIQTKVHSGLRSLQLLRDKIQ